MKEKLKFIKLKYIVVEATPGSNREYCKKECIKYALDNEIPVKLFHNDIAYYFDPQIIFATSFNTKTNSFNLENNKDR